MRTRVKICGFTRVEDAVCAARLGVDAIGLVFYPPSPRHVDIGQAIKIVNALPAFVSIVALFVDEQASRIREVLAQVPIDCLQFHGDEPADACRLYGKRYMKAVRMQEGIDIPALAQHYHDASALLLDAYHPGEKGGTGNQFDWNRIPAHCALPLILAGGLDADNARQAVQTVRPYALDVSSGVEAEKGLKDALKMAAFIDEVNEGDRIII
ncbi:MAG: phosphoribosylanthranilate isomerase [Methylobacter sp.]|nr:phosphoribosylanthranilate isomerase [Methylobacter sp.]MDP2100601.1 phosphoribosylanthranilate isomerase [Methylobacter sp.]MDP2428881.1 phosphoribosylanthranilate isomerase [Methylobacter sp.]MDP3053350.1 phosphoribosylanthranilate isomerase [Methylobacter sp.]MDP3362110.1 phosphoribosylanthranilate isomerase [Methylobacter sp.]